MMLELFLEAREEWWPTLYQLEIGLEEFSHSQDYTNRMAIYKNNKFHITKAIKTCQIEIM